MEESGVNGGGIHVVEVQRKRRVIEIGLLLLQLILRLWHGE